MVVIYMAYFSQALIQFCMFIFFHLNITLFLKKMSSTEIQSNQRNGDEVHNDYDIEQVVNDVIRGKYGNGHERVERLRQAGYDPKVIQENVNKRLK